MRIITAEARRRAKVRRRCCHIVGVVAAVGAVIALVATAPHWLAADAPQPAPPAAVVAAAAPPAVGPEELINNRLVPVLDHLSVPGTPR